MEWLNKEVRYTVTGFRGIVTAYAVYNTKRECVLIEATDGAGRPVELWADITLVEIID